ncbi:MAG: sugar phosphate isomerase/epimerase [Planctomycetes bacterium]|nr:sugar phosphate isomerase/epimerase [Planctomycetota bacterium]
MKLSLSTWLYDHLDAASMMARVKAAGYDAVEISGGHWPEKWPWRDLLKLAMDNGIAIESIHCVHHELKNWQTDDAAFSEYHRRFYGSIAGGDGIVMVEHVPMAKSHLARSAERLGFLAELCRPLGYVLSTENMSEARDEQLEVLESLLQGPVKFTFDAAHAAYASLDPALFFRFADRLVNVHVYDVARGLGLGDWLPVGLGDMNWKAIVEWLVRIGYPGPLTVELNEANLRRVLDVCRRAASAARPVAFPFAAIEYHFAVWSRNYLRDMIMQVSSAR